MSFCTRGFLCFLYALLGCAVSWSACAQQAAAPAWVSARAVGATLSRPATAVDAAGNTYATGYFTGTTIIGGTTLVSQGSSDSYVAKYTSAGVLAWVYVIGSPGNETVYDIALDAAGNAYVVGTSTTAVTLSSSLGLAAGSRMFIIRISPQGIPEWAQQSLTMGSGTSIGIDATGHVYVAGSFSTSFTVGATTVTVPAGYGPAGTFLLRLLAATGTVESLNAVGFYPLVGANTTYSPGITVAPTGAVYVLQIFQGQTTVGAFTFSSAGSTDVLLIKYTAQGALDWVQSVSGPNTEFVTGGAVDPSGNVYIAGYANGPTTFGTTTQSSAGGHDGYLAKYSPLGALQWVRTSGGPTFDGWDGVTLDGGGNPYVVGGFTGTAQFGASTFISAGGEDIAVAAYTPQGQMRWVQQAGGPAGDTGSGIGLDNQGDVYVSGSLRGSCAFGPLLVAPTAISPTAPFENFLARLGSSALATTTSRLQQVGVYPTPATEAVYFPGISVGSSIQIFDALGRMVRQVLATPAAQVSVLGLPAGVYTLRGTDASGRACIGKALVK